MPVSYTHLRQTAVVAFQLGDAFTNLIVPTSGCLIGSLAIAKIEWSNWIKFMWKFLGVLMIGAIITILIAVGTGSVSYTHLDVYKRQLRNRLHRQKGSSNRKKPCCW